MLGLLYCCCAGTQPALRGRHEAIAGERRIRRTITYTLGNGAKVLRTVLVTGREDIAALNLLHRRTEGFGEQHIGGKGRECMMLDLISFLC